MGNGNWCGAFGTDGGGDCGAEKREEEKKKKISKKGWVDRSNAFLYFASSAFLLLFKTHRTQKLLEISQQHGGVEVNIGGISMR